MAWPVVDWLLPAAALLAAVHYLWRALARGPSGCRCPAAGRCASSPKPRAAALVQIGRR